MTGSSRPKPGQSAEGFEYSYFRRERNVIYESLILGPNGLETYVQYVRGGYVRSLPSPAHRGRER